MNGDIGEGENEIKEEKEIEKQFFFRNALPAVIT